MLQGPLPSPQVLLRVGPPWLRPWARAARVAMRPTLAGRGGHGWGPPLRLGAAGVVAVVVGALIRLAFAAGLPPPPWKVG